MVSHALSRFDAYERDSFVAAVAALAVAAGAAVAVARPHVPDIAGVELRALARDRVIAVLAVVCLLEVGFILALALFTPPTERDALGYHLQRGLLWMQESEVEDNVNDVTDARLNEAPWNAELLQAATMLVSGSVRWVGLVQVAALLFAVARAIYGIGVRVGLERRQATFGALLFATLPVVALQAPAALNDLVVASLVAVAAFFALGRTRAEIGLGCVAIALLVGTKGTAFIALPVLLAVVVLAQRGHLPCGRWPSSAASPEPCSAAPGTPSTLRRARGSSESATRIGRRTAQ